MWSRIVLVTPVFFTSFDMPISEATCHQLPAPLKACVFSGQIQFFGIASRDFYRVGLLDQFRKRSHKLCVHYYAGLNALARPYCNMDIRCPQYTRVLQTASIQECMKPRFVGKQTRHISYKYMKLFKTGKSICLQFHLCPIRFDGLELFSHG